MYKYAIYLLFLILSTSACSSGDRPTLSGWANKQLSDNDKILCKKNINADYFIIIENNGKLKTGYSVDITSNADSDSPLSYIISWKFMDKDGNSLESKTPPKDVKRNVVVYGEHIYAESVDLRGLVYKEYPEVHVKVGITKSTEKNIKMATSDNLSDKLICVIK